VVLLYWIVNIGVAVTAVLVLVGWLRNRRQDDYRDIHQSEISADLMAGEDLLNDALAEAEQAAQPRDRSGGL
jgi:hypothetical protein